MDYPKSRASELGLYNGKFTGGIPGLLPASVDDAGFMNDLVDSILAVQVAAGQTNVEGDVSQLLKGILALIQKQVILDDTGTAGNTYAATNVIPLTADTLTSGLEQRIVLARTNTSASTFAPDGLAAKPILGLAMQPLQGGEMVAGGIATLSYSPTANSNAGAWILVRCAGGAQQGAIATQSNQLITLGQAGALSGTTGMLGLFPFSSAPSGWLKVNGAAIPIAAYSTLAGLLYCGDANNATAAWGYRCTNQSSPTTSRSISGSYIVLPDARGEFLRGWDDGRGVDVGRLLWALQSGQILSHTHGGAIAAVGDHQHVSYSLSPFTRTGELAGSGSTGYMVNSRDLDTGTLTSWNGSHAHGLSIYATGGSENLVRNLAALICIKY